MNHDDSSGKSWVGNATPGSTPGRHAGWHTRGARYYPTSVSDFVDLSRLFREFVVEGHAPATPLLDVQDKVLTFGSCFAAHLRRILVDTGFAADTIHLTAGLNNTFALRDFMSWCSTGQQTAGGFRYGRGADGTITDWQPEHEWRQYRQHIAGAAALVFVIGLAEVWEDVVTGGVFWRGIPSAIFEEERHRFRLSTVAENVANLRETIAAAREINPTAPIILALSPIPLVSTYRAMSCMTADTVSKSILRLALDEIMTLGMPRVWYWPSFEMVRSVGMHLYVPTFGEDGDVRHPSDHLVSEIVDCFVSYYYPHDAHQWFREQRAARELARGRSAAPDAYALGNLIELADLYLGPRHRRRGWSYVDRDGVWTEDDEATLSFTLNENGSSDLEVALHGDACVTDGHRENGFRLHANGREVGSFRFAAPIAPRTCRAIVPRDVVGADGQLELKLVIDAPISPKSLGLSEDSRRLGFFLRNLRIGAV